MVKVLTDVQAVVEILISNMEIVLFKKAVNMEFILYIASCVNRDIILHE